MPEPTAPPIPLVLFGRVATLLRVGEETVGARADLAMVGAWGSGHGEALPLTPGRAAELSLSVQSRLRTAFEICVSRHMRARHPGSFMHDSCKVDKAYLAAAVEWTDSRALLCFMRASPDERVWSIPSLDFRHWGVDTLDEARRAVAAAARAGLDGARREALELGFDFPSSALALSQAEASTHLPRMPEVPLTSCESPGWAQGREDVERLCASALALFEARELGGSSREAPSRGRKPAL